MRLAAAPILAVMEPRIGRDGPFRPGPGRLPPYLAGREAEQKLFRNRLADLADGLAPASEIILYGPRGNGKTALLFWLEDEAAASGVETLWLTPSAIPAVDDLVYELTPWWRRLAPRGLGAFGFSLKLGGEGSPLLSRVLARRVRRKPLLLLLDEAHTLDPEVGRALLNASQQVGRRFPFQLVLAGTPDLETRLRSLGASFWNRSKQLRINLLDDKAAAAAIRKPLEDGGFSIAGEPLAPIVRESHGYPWFLQLWGEALWGRITAEGMGTAGSVTKTQVWAARPLFEEQRALYYRQRYAELEEQRLLAPARALADAFSGRRRLSAARLDEVIEEAVGGPFGGMFGDGETSDRAAAAQKALRHLGYVWQPGAGLEWEAGIPSLMDFVREHAPAGRAVAPRRS